MENLTKSLLEGKKVRECVLCEAQTQSCSSCIYFTVKKAQESTPLCTEAAKVKKAHGEEGLQTFLNAPNVTNSCEVYKGIEEDHGILDTPREDLGTAEITYPVEKK